MKLPGGWQHYAASEDNPVEPSGATAKVLKATIAPILKSPSTAV